MNAPATPAAISAQLEFLPLGRLKPSRTHIQELRRARFDAKVLQELAESIKKVGILQPIVVRPRDEGFEIVAGERRFLAAQLAGLASLPANVRQLTDDQVLEVQLIENLQREGLHELEEAEGYEELMKLKKINADAVAGMVGKSRSYVYARTKLLALCPEARKAFYGGGLDASRALLVARIGHHDTQRRALKDILEDSMTYRVAHRHIVDNFMLKIKGAPFDPADGNLVPKAGTCGACPKRTGNERDLFSDIKDADVCTDPECFDDKRQAHYGIARKALEAKGEKIIAGDAAKKVLPNWDDPHASDEYRSRLGGGYVSLDDSTWTSGRSRKVADILGPDYKPVLIQHPGTGRIIRAATQQAVAAASLKGRAGSGGAPYSPPRTLKPAGPDVDEEEFKALLKLIHEKAPKKFGRQHLRAIAARLFQVVNPRRYGTEAMKAAWKWPSLNHSHYSAKLPKEAAALDERGLHLFMLDTLFVGCYAMERKPLLDLLGISEKKVREQVIAERKKAQAEKRGGVKPAAMKIPAGDPAFKAAAGLAVIVGAHPITRAEALNRVRVYIHSKELQKKDRIKLDQKLKNALGKVVPDIRAFELAAMVNERLTLIEKSATAWPFATKSRAPAAEQSKPKSKGKKK